MELFEGQLDWGTYYFFRFQAKQVPSLQPLMQIGDWLGSYLIVAILLVCAVAITPAFGRRRMAWVVVITFLFGALLVEGIKIAAPRQRPPDAQNMVAAAKMNSGFPSQTVFLAAFASLMLAFAVERRFGRKWVISTAAALLIVFVCISQLWLALHFVTDVIAGMSGGIGLAMLGRWAATDSLQSSPPRGILTK